MKVFTFMRADGGMSILNPCISIDDPPGFTEEQAEQRALLTAPPDAIDIKARELSELPSDFTFRNAWKHSGTIVDVDMPKAREIWCDKMRVARKPLLESLDIQYMIADESGDAQKKKQLADQKKVLRDVTLDPAIEAAQTTEALKLVWPEILGPRP